jgi:hypothetical protein
VSVLHGRRLRPPDPDITLAPGDRVSLLLPAPQDSPFPDPDDGSRERSASHESSGT